MYNYTYRKYSTCTMNHFDIRMKEKWESKGFRCELEMDELIKKRHSELEKCKEQLVRVRRGRYIYDTCKKTLI